MINLLQSPQDQAGHIYPKATSSQCRPPRSLHATRRYCRPRPDSHIPPDNYCSSVKSSVLEMHYTYCVNQCQSGIILFRWIVLDLPIHRSNSPLEAWINITIFYRGISCSAMFDHFLNSHKDSTECNWWILDFFYLGESFPLAMVLGDLSKARLNLYYPGPPSRQRSTSPISFNFLQLRHILPEDLEHLRIQGVFKCPDKVHLDTFLTVSLEYVVSCLSSHEPSRASPAACKWNHSLTLLHSICFVEDVSRLPWKLAPTNIRAVPD